MYPFTLERPTVLADAARLAAAGAKPRPNPLLNILALAGGSYLAWRGYMGTCPVKAALYGVGDEAARLTDRA